MKIIQWSVSMGMANDEQRGEIEFEDDATDEEIESAVSETIFSIVQWGWSVKEGS